MITLIQLVKDRSALLDHVIAGNLYYNITVDNIDNVKGVYQFCVPVEEQDTATFLVTEKASYLMRWIRKGLENNTLIKIV